jgi:hypothetical protein
MRPDSNQMDDYAAECRRRAALVDDPELKATFSDLALGWEELADLQRRLREERRRPKLAAGRNADD